MRIPLGNFGNVIAQPPPKVNVVPAAFDKGGAALQKLGDTILGIGVQKLQADQQHDEEVDRSRAMVAVTGHEAAAQEKLATIRERLDAGDLTREDAPKVFKSEMTNAVSESIKGVPLWLQDQAKVRFDGVTTRALIGLDRIVTTHRHQELSGNLELIRDTMAKDAGLPGADVDKITTDFASAAQHLGPQAGLGTAKVSKIVQDFSDGVFFDHAKLRAQIARDNLGELSSLENELKAPGGYYTTRLDLGKRTVILGSVAAHRIALENRLTHQADKAEARAELTISKIDQQISSGVPATPEMWADWGKRTAGTSHYEAFQERLQSEQEVQRLLRDPPEKQAAYVREREAALMQDGGTLRDRANLDRLRKVLDTNRKQLEDAPLIFAQNRTGEAVKSIDLTALFDPARRQEVAGIFESRTETLAALRRQYGDVVKMRALPPFEAEGLTKALDRMSPDQQIEIFGGLRQLIGNDSVYQGTLAQIAPDSPVKALAGMLAARGTDYTVSHVFSSDETVKARQTATLALIGESLLNPTKAQKGQDGKTNTWIMPKKTDMLRRFIDAVGDTYAGTSDGKVQGTPQGLDQQFELVQATYAGMMASSGGVRTPDVIDTTLFDQAIARTTPVIKQGGVHFLKPVVGMSDEQFREKLRAALPEDLKPQYDRLPLRNVRSNQYVILNGARPLTDKAGNPLIVTVQP